MSGTLILMCERCGFPIAPGKGSIYATYQEIGAARDGDGRIHWYTRHDKCSEHLEESSYELGADQLMTPGELARWTAHLMAKRWFALTDWDDLLREVAGEIPACRVRVVARRAA